MKQVKEFGENVFLIEDSDLPFEIDSSQIENKKK